MKRSQIIDTIITGFYGIEEASDESKTRAEIILKRLEEAGMQPPAIKEPCETFVLHNGQYIKTEDSFIFTHKWDEE